jgi:sulfite exporter TauE/SafE
MLSSIHPLGEKGRNNKWSLTIASFTLGSVAAGSLVGFGLGWVGSFAFQSVSDQVLLIATAATAVFAGALDIVAITPPGSERQVNETWIGHYRGWIYGGSFGIELGLGLMTYVVTWGVYATLIAETLTASPLWGALVGAVFGLGRAVAPLLAGRIDRPSRLTSFHQRMARLGAPVRKGAAISTTSLGALVIVGGLL